MAAWRIIRRHISKSLRGINPYPTKLLFNFLKDTRQYYLNKADTDTVEAMRVYLEEHKDSVEPPDAECLRMLCEKYKFFIPPTADFTRKYLEKYKEKLFVVKNNKERECLFALLAALPTTRNIL